VTDDRADLMLEILKRMQSDLASVRRDMTSLAVRVSALEDFTRGITTSIFGMQAEITAINHRLDRIERRLDLTEETE
jgi:predicted  nucleic acid-binding Zn-ribbon protein